MNGIADKLDCIEAVNRRQIEVFSKAAIEMNPVQDCANFHRQVRGLEAVIVHTYQITAYHAIREESPEQAAKMWKRMVVLCDLALDAIRGQKERYASCGAPELYDLVLDYRLQSQERFSQNQQDAECPPMPEGLFPKPN